jgi:hypothetical protein
VDCPWAQGRLCRRRHRGAHSILPPS